MRRSNLFTLRKFFNWRSSWCSKFFYRSLLYKDLFIQFYLSSLFFKLRFNTSSIQLNYLSTNLVICTFDIYINSLKRLKRYNLIFFKKVSNIYRSLLMYLSNLQKNKFLKKKKEYFIRLQNIKLIYLNFFFYIFKHKKKKYMRTIKPKSYASTTNRLRTASRIRKLRIDSSSARIMRKYKNSRRKYTPFYVFDMRRRVRIRRKLKKKYWKIRWFKFKSLKLYIWKHYQWFHDAKKIFSKNRFKKFLKRKLIIAAFKYKKMAVRFFYKKYLSARYLKYPLLKIRNFFSIFFHTQQHLYSYNSYLNFNKIRTLFNFNKNNIQPIKYEYYYNIIDFNNSLDTIKNIFFINFTKSIYSTYNLYFFKYSYLVSKYFFIALNKHNAVLIKPIFYVLDNISLFLKNNFFYVFCLNNLINILFYKTIIFSYKFYNKFSNNTIKDNVLEGATIIKNFYNSEILKKNKINFLKSKVSLFLMLSYNTFKKFKLLKFLTYYKKKRVSLIKKIQLLLNYLCKKKKWHKLINFKNKYLFIFWIFKKIWFTLFNTIYIKYIYNLYKKVKYINNKLVILILNFLNILNSYLYLFNFKSIKFSSVLFIKNINNLLKLRKFSSILIVKINKRKIKRFFKYIYTTMYFNSLFLLLEKTLFFYSNKNIKYILMPNVFFFIKPFISSAKLLCDYLYFKLRKKLTINRAYNKIKKWQMSERAAIAVSFKLRWVRFHRYTRYEKAELFKNQLFKNDFFRESLMFRSPLRGIRCICSGPPYKAKRKLRKFYHIWVANFSLTGLMPLQQLKYQIDYYQTFIILKRATIGLKVWILLESYVVLK